MSSFWDALFGLPTYQIVFFAFALVVAFGFEFINGFHDTANAVTTVIYTHTLKATPAVVYSGALNFLGVLAGGTAVAFSIVHLLPVDLLVHADSTGALVMVLSLLLAGVIWNLGTWYYGMPVSSSHTLIGSILGVGIANGLILGKGVDGVNWDKAQSVGLALLLSPLIGFGLAAALLLLMKRVLRNPKLYIPPEGDKKPPHWVRGILLSTCGAVSFAHGSNDGQKGMGLILLVLIGFLPTHFALNPDGHGHAAAVYDAALGIQNRIQDDPAISAEYREALAKITTELKGVQHFSQLPETVADRWRLRQAIYIASADPRHATAEEREIFERGVEFVPLWVVIGVALALGLGTMIGYKRIVVTVAEKIGKTHLTYGQGAAAETVAAATILMADGFHMPVSTTHVLSSGVAGTMAANGSGVQGRTIARIAAAWVFTLPAAMVLSAGLYTLGRALFV